MKREPDWDNLPPSELAILRTISARASAKHLHELKMLLVGILGSLVFIGWRLNA